MSELFTYFKIKSLDEDIQNLAKANKVASNASSDTRTLLRELESRHDTLLLITQGIWTYLQKKYDLDTSELLKVIEEIDMRDGHMDGRARSNKRLWKCSNCGKENNPCFVSCIKCDTKRIADELDEPFKKA